MGLLKLAGEMDKEIVEYGSGNVVNSNWRMW
jgi:hypothetical protein